MALLETFALRSGFHTELWQQGCGFALFKLSICTQTNGMGNLCIRVYLSWGNEFTKVELS